MKKNSFLKDVKQNKALLLFVLPGTIWFAIFCYLPMFGILLAFKDFKITSDSFILNLINSPWTGLKNFEFFFKSSDAWLITRNTLGYNFIFIFLNIVVPLAIAIGLHELLNKKISKGYQSAMFLPYFLSWVIVSYCLFAFLSPDKGLLNSIFQTLGIEEIQWYSNPKPWPFIIIFMNTWKSIGYNTVIFLATIAGIDRSYYEAATIDGASKFQQLKGITVPLMKPVIIILFILALGGVFRADFGLFYQLPMNSGPLYPVTNVLDTYIYRALINSGDIGMSSAISLIQSIVGCILILSANKIVKRYDKDRALF